MKRIVCISKLYGTGRKQALLYFSKYISWNNHEGIKQSGTISATRWREFAWDRIQNKESRDVKCGLGGERERERMTIMTMSLVPGFSYIWSQSTAILFSFVIQ